MVPARSSIKSLCIRRDRREQVIMILTDRHKMWETDWRMERQNKVGAGGGSVARITSAALRLQSRQLHGRVMGWFSRDVKKKTRVVRWRSPERTSSIRSWRVNNLSCQRKVQNIQCLWRTAVWTPAGLFTDKQAFTVITHLRSRDEKWRTSEPTGRVTTVCTRSSQMAARESCEYCTLHSPEIRSDYRRQTLRRWLASTVGGFSGRGEKFRLLLRIYRQEKSIKHSCRVVEGRVCQCRALKHQLITITC